MLAATLVVFLPLASSWTLASPPVAPKVSGHGICRSGNDNLLLFGGLKEDRKVTNDLWIHQDNEWKLLQQQSKDGPGPRMYVRAAALDDQVFVMGGWDPEAKGSGGTFKDEVWSLNQDTLEWKACDPLPCGPVSRHTAVTVGDKVIVHTFKPGDEGTVVLTSDGTSHVQATTGDAPQGLSMCCAAALNDHQMVLFGGSTKTQEMSRDSYLLDTNTWEWTKLESKGDAPTPRASPSMARIDDSSVLVFGGAGLRPQGYEGGAGLIGSDETFKLSIQNGKVAEWTLVQNDATKPRARVAASLDLIPGEAHKYLLSGGWDPATAETFDDANTLEL